MGDESLNFQHIKVFFRKDATFIKKYPFNWVHMIRECFKYYFAVINNEFSTGIKDLADKSLELSDIFEKEEIPELWKYEEFREFKRETLEKYDIDMNDDSKENNNNNNNNNIIKTNNEIEEIEEFSFAINPKYYNQTNAIEIKSGRTSLEWSNEDDQIREFRVENQQRCIKWCCDNKFFLPAIEIESLVKESEIEISIPLSLREGKDFGNQIRLRKTVLDLLKSANTISLEKNFPIHQIKSIYRNIKPRSEIVRNLEKKGINIHQSEFKFVNLDNVMKRNGRYSIALAEAIFKNDITITFADGEEDAIPKKIFCEKEKTYAEMSLL